MYDVEESWELSSSAAGVVRSQAPDDVERKEKKPARGVNPSRISHSSRKVGLTR